MLKRCLKRLAILLVVSLSLLFPLSSSELQTEDYVYEITESELTTLETTLEKQKLQIEQQKIQLNDLKKSFSNQTIQLDDLKKSLEQQKTLSETLKEQLITSNKMLENAQTSFQIYEKEVKRKKIKIGLITGISGVFIGGLTTIIIMNNK